MDSGPNNNLFIDLCDEWFGMWKILAIVAAFTATTTISLILYRRTYSMIREYRGADLGIEVDREALNRLREALRRYREPSAEELLAELKSINSEAEKFLNESRRRDSEGEGCGNS